MFINAQVLTMKKMILFWVILVLLIYNFLLKCENTLASHTGILLSLSYTYFYLI